MAPTRKKKKQAAGRFLKPMLATLVDAAFDDPKWVFETKWDGFRVISRIAPGKAALFSRNGNSVTRTYPSVAAALSTIRHRAVLDGELVALDRAGRTRFQLLQNAQRSRARLRYYVFDLLMLDGVDLRQLPLLDRKQRLKAILPRTAIVRLSRHVRRNGVAAFRAAKKRGLEGIVAKLADGRYFSGKRTREWLKIKTSRRQEVVIAGFTQPRKSRKYFGALVLVLRAGNSWQYVGHTGTGFSHQSLRTIHSQLVRLKRIRKPFSERIANQDAITWVRPSLVCEVQFAEWTKDGRMRHPSFVGLRSDKPATSVAREYAKPGP